MYKYLLYSVYKILTIYINDFSPNIILYVGLRDKNIFESDIYLKISLNKILNINIKFEKNL